MTTTKGSPAGMVEKIVLPVAVGVISAALWWMVTQSWIAALVAILAITVTAFAVWYMYPLFVHVRTIRNSEIADVFQNQAAAQEEIKSLAVAARKLDILTIRGLGIIGLNDSMLRRYIFSGSGSRRHIRVLLLSPDGANARARAAEIGESPEAFAHGINLAIQRMRELSRLGLHDLEVYLYDRRPSWRVIGLDRNYFVSAFGANAEGHVSVMYKIDGSKEHALFEALSRMFDDLCETGERII